MFKQIVLFLALLTLLMAQSDQAASSGVDLKVGGVKSVDMNTMENTDEQK